MPETDFALAALFDLDGTLVNSEPRSLATWSRLLDAHGVAYDDELLRRFMGRRGLDVLNEHPHLLPGLTLDDLVAQLREIAASPELPPVQYLPESVAFLHQLHAHGSPFALVTSAGPDWAKKALTDLGVRELFKGLVTAADVTEGKPAPHGYLQGADILGHAPEHIVVFEDTPAGVAAGKNAGMRVVGVTTTHPPDALADADLIVDHLTEVNWPRIAPATTPTT
ncbi:HAD family hydrolase [Salinactinospora qingdaonensis]|uniref:Hexitol phosphatase HxpA n=1 Tax=Salinactinospora qingdaonensis TaxID=702744 RepID=A0ABP7FIW9_9ACTN